jgi:Ankyrin repeats (3 copies)
MPNANQRLQSRERSKTPRWLLVWWCMTVPWLLLAAGMYAVDQTITRWRTGADSPLFATWGDDIRAVVFPLNELLIVIWIGVAAFFILRLVGRRVRIPTFLPIGIFLPLLGFGVGHVPSRDYEYLFVHTIGPGEVAGTLLARAASHGDTAAIASLLATGIDIEAVDYSPLGSQYAGGETSLMMAAKKRQQRSVAYLLRRGANPNHGNSYGETPLMRAVASNEVAIVRLLLTHGANPRASTSYRGASARQRSVLSVAEYVQDPLILNLIRAASDSVARKDNHTQRH